jgi:hypothetical protein
MTKDNYDVIDGVFLLIILIFGTLVMVGLFSELDKKYSDKDNQAATNSIIFKASGDFYDMKTVIVDGCEYLINFDYNNQAFKLFTHKGNCTNVIHNTKDLEKE